MRPPLAAVAAAAAVAVAAAPSTPCLQRLETRRALHPSYGSRELLDAHFSNV